MPRFYGKLYPGRLNQQELRKWRAPEQYEAILTDLFFMGIITQEQFEQYTHRWILPDTHGHKPQHDPFPQLEKSYYIRDYDDITAEAVTISADGEKPTNTVVIGATIFQLQFNDGQPPQDIPPAPLGWYIQPWIGTADGWVKDTDTRAFKAEEFHYVIADGETFYIHLTGEDKTDLPEWTAFTENKDQADRVYTLPDIWIDLPLYHNWDLHSHEYIPTTQLNLQNGQTRDKPSETRSDEVEMNTVAAGMAPNESVYIYNETLPFVAAPNDPRPFILLLHANQEPNKLYVAKEILKYDAASDFPATGDADKVYDDTSDNERYYWDGTKYVELDENNAEYMYLLHATGWLQTSLDQTLKPSKAVINSYKRSFIQNQTVNQPEIEDEHIPVQAAQGIQLIQENTDGLNMRINLAQFFDACTHYSYDNDTLVLLEVILQVQYDWNPN
jgi:hypothetical protein